MTQTAADDPRDNAIKHTRRALEFLKNGHFAHAVDELDHARGFARWADRARDPAIGPKPDAKPKDYTHDELETALQTLCKDALRTVSPAFLVSVLDNLATDMRALAQQDARIEVAFAKFNAALKSRPVGEFQAFKGGWEAAQAAPVTDPSLPPVTAAPPGVYEALPTLRPVPLRSTHATCQEWVRAIDGKPLLVIGAGETRTVGHVVGVTIKPL